MDDIPVKVEDLGKRYRIRAAEIRSRTLGKTLLNMLVSPLSYLRSSLAAPSAAETLWALRHVSFEVKRGEVLGVLGQNGAGKSTLLRILSRITLPTEGQATVHGRVGSLLQIGTGFNSELTGRENIYLNGTIMGMKSKEIDRKFDQIVEFSGVRAFIDNPIKRYSSGMIVRLGFSVAIFMDPDVLLVDEVLSVGDAAFRQKSLEKVFELVSNGCSVVFVSHDLFMIQRLCKRAILLQAGNVIEETDISVMIEHYLSRITNILAPRNWLDLSSAPHQGTGAVRFTHISYRSGNAGLGDQAYPDGSLEFLLELESETARTIAGVSVSLFDLSGFRLINAGSMHEFPLKRGLNSFRIFIHSLHLNPGTYLLALWLVGPAEVLLDQILSAAYINVVPKIEPDVLDINPYHDKVTARVDVAAVEVGQELRD
jgi:lipopolysaccharide transport system ATP-binding protein